MDSFLRVFFPNTTNMFLSKIEIQILMFIQVGWRIFLYVQRVFINITCRFEMCSVQYFINKFEVEQLFHCDNKMSLYFT